MKALSRAIVAACLTLCLAGAHASPAEWTQPQQPFRLYGNTWYVGTRGLSAILIQSSQGLVLIDGTLPENATQVEAHIRALGFALTDVKWILNTHAHADHAGAIAALVRDTGARVLASERGAQELRLGGRYPDDPQFGDAPLYPPVAKVEVIADHGVLRLGDLAITAHATPGHTPGSTSWSWTACEQGRCLHMVYADSLTALAAGTYRYSDPAHPERVAAFRRSIATVAGLPCDILMTPHPGQSDLLERAARRDAGVTPNPLIDAQACRAYAKDAGQGLDAQLAKERSGQDAAP